MFRIGSGFDLHPLVQNKKMILGGIEIPFEFGFQGHSDGDILIHAFIDALFGALGLSDIGTFFPDTDSQWKNVNSFQILLPLALNQLKKSSYEIGNLDCTLILERPKLSSYISQIKENLASAIKIDPSKISIKATRTEKCFLNPPHEAGIAMVSLLLMNKNLKISSLK